MGPPMLETCVDDLDLQGLILLPQNPLQLAGIGLPVQGVAKAKCRRPPEGRHPKHLQRLRPLHIGASESYIVLTLFQDNFGPPEEVVPVPSGPVGSDAGVAFNGDNEEEERDPGEQQ